MNRDLAVPLLLALLLIAALPSTGLAPSFVPSTPDAFLGAALILAVFFALLVVPWLEHSGPLRVLALLVAAGPFLAYGLLASPRPPDTVPLPGMGVIAVGVAAVVVALLPRRQARMVAILLLAWIGGDLLMGRAGLPLLPAGFNPVLCPVLDAGPARRDTFSAPDARPPVEGLLAGGPAPVPEDPAARPFGDDIHLVEATVGVHPSGTGLVALAGPRIPEAWKGAPVDGHVVVAWPYAADVDPLLLDVLDGVIVLAEAHDDVWWRAAADGVAVYVRRGGVLVGPGTGRAWPGALGRRLQTASRARVEGPEGARDMGLGAVLRAGSEDQIRASLAWGFERKRLETVFDRGRAVVPLPAGLEPWRDEPASRRPQGLLLLFYALVAAALDRVLRGRAPRLLGLVAPSVALGLALAWTATRDPGVTAHAIELDLGGCRRVEAVALAAGPEGWAGHVRWSGDGFAFLRGGRVDANGRVLVAPGRTAWVVRERAASGPETELVADPSAFNLRALLRGGVGQADLEAGRGGTLSADIEGVKLPVARILRVR